MGGAGIDRSDLLSRQDGSPVQREIALADTSQRPIDSLPDEVALIGGFTLDDGPLLRVARYTAQWRTAACGVSGETRGIRRAAGRLTKTGVTCLIDHKWPYNQNLSTPQSWGA